MNKQLMLKFGPIAGLIVSLMTTGVAGYRIFAAPLTHAEELPSLPTPTVTSKAEASVKTVYDDVFVTPTPKPSAAPTGVVPTKAPTSSPSVTVTGGVSVKAHTGEFEDESEDHVEFEKKETHVETPEPTKAPEPTEAPEH